MKIIESPSNSEVKELSLIKNKSKVRRDRNVFVVEGRREFERAVKSGFKLLKKYYNPELLNSGEGFFGFWGSLECPTVQLTGKAFEKVATRESTEGIIGLFEGKELKLEDLKLKENPLVIVLDQVQKPGNIGAVFRTADAVGAAAIFLTNTPGDLFNPHTVRASLGCVFSVPFVKSDPKTVKGFLKKNQFNLFSAIPEAQGQYYDCNLTGPTAIVFGAEDIGVSKDFRVPDLKGFSIPMKGIADSLNVSASVAVVLYEALRQRSIS